MRVKLKMNPTSLAIAGLALASLFPGQALAHRTWLLPSSTQVDGKEPFVTIDAAVSENLFDFDTNALKLEGLRIVGPDGNEVKPENQFAGRLRSSFDVRLSNPGSYRISNVAESAIATYTVNGETKRWRGVVDAMAKDIPANAENLKVTRMHSRLETFVSSGKPNPLSSRPSNQGLELEPITHPNALAVGENARFRFLLDGKPAAGLVLSVVPGGVRYRGVLKEMRVETDAKGEFSVNWPDAGMYWINASYPPRAQNQGNAQPQAAPAPVARRVSYGGTVEVLP